jgi:alginate O-acetyltransferase complex protein AlgI
MVFNSIKFLFFFMIVVSVYFTIPHRFRWVWLLAASYYFYMLWKPAYILLIVITTAVTYYAGIRMGQTDLRSKRKRFLLLGLLCNLGVLFLFKYYNFFNDSLKTIFQHTHLLYGIPSLDLILPLGISFYIFKSLSYSIDVYRGDRAPERHLGFLALYVAFFPQLLAGPIERATRFLPQLYEKFDFDYQRVTKGLKLMLWGFFQKMVIADNLAVFVDTVYSHPTQYQGMSLLIGAFFYSFQIYCDFSGYSDIAIGAAQVMGFRTAENFNLPYFSKSIPEFWRRWHISLSTWFRDYLYIPLGGNRVSIPRWYFNLFFVLLICGLWHGANWTFVVWGGLHGLYLVISALTQNVRKKIHKIIGLDKVPRLHSSFKTLLTFSLVSLAWIFFRAQSISDAIYVLSHLMTGLQEIFKPGVLMNTAPWDSLRFEWITGLVSIGVLVLVEWEERHGSIVETISTKPIWIRWPAYYFILLSILLFGHFGTKQFIYFQF